MLEPVELERINADWVAAKYGPKTIGLGHAGGPALLFIRPGQYQSIEDMAADVARIRAALNAVRGIPTEALENGESVLAAFDRGWAGGKVAGKRAVENLLQRVAGLLERLCAMSRADYAPASESGALWEEAEKLLEELRDR